MKRSRSHKACYVYEAVCLTFGDSASPYLAQFVPRSHALDKTMILLRDLYMDDILHSEEAVKDSSPGWRWFPCLKVVQPSCRGPARNLTRGSSNWSKA